jgi:pyruvate-formate lyase
MTVTYGVARENDRSDSAAQDGDNDTSPLLGTDASPSPAKDNEGVAGIPSSVGNLANTIIGSGASHNSTVHYGVADDPRMQAC